MPISFRNKNKLYSIVALVLVQFNYGSTSYKWACSTLTSLTLREKIAQLFVVAAASSFEQPTESLASSFLASPYTMDQSYIEELITQYGIGGIIFLYRSTPEKQLRLTNYFQQLSHLPLLICQDCEWGLSMRLDETVQYPRNGLLGTIDDETLIYQLGIEIGRQCRAIGVHLNCAPVVDVNSNPDNPVINTRSFGSDPELVARFGALYARGLQDTGVIACAKHFPGHGDTTVDSHLELPTVAHSIERLEVVELYPFRELINQDVGAVMMGHLVVPALDATPAMPASLSYPIVTNFLKKQLGFSGLVITDALGMKAITNHFKAGEIELQAFLAGNDIILCPLDVPKAINLIEQVILEGVVTEQELDERVLKILVAKAQAGLHDQRIIADVDIAVRSLTTAYAYELEKTLVDLVSH